MRVRARVCVYAYACAYTHTLTQPLHTHLLILILIYKLKQGINLHSTWFSNAKGGYLDIIPFNLLQSIRVT
jgi:hypothetical protein